MCGERPDGGFALGEERQSVVDDIVGETRPFGYCAGLAGSKVSMSGSVPSFSIAAMASSRL